MQRLGDPRIIAIAHEWHGETLRKLERHEDAIAEFVMTALLLRHVPLPRADQRLREGHWDYWAGSPGALRTELGGGSIGLLGFGVWYFRRRDF